MFFFVRLTHIHSRSYIVTTNGSLVKMRLYYNTLSHGNNDFHLTLKLSNVGPRIVLRCVIRNTRRCRHVCRMIFRVLVLHTSHVKEPAGFFKNVALRTVTSVTVFESLLSFGHWGKISSIQPRILGVCRNKHQLQNFHGQ